MDCKKGLWGYTCYICLNFFAVQPSSTTCKYFIFPVIEHISKYFVIGCFNNEMNNVLGTSRASYPSYYCKKELTLPLPPGSNGIQILRHMQG